jgi:hypothetical protein
MNRSAIFEYTAKLTSTPHAEDDGEPVHCLVEIGMVDQLGRCRPVVELEEEAGDLILFTLNAGPRHRIADSKIWKVDEQRLTQLGKAKAVNRVGSNQIHFY